ncbi:hypothetical protein MLD38_018920 [Melastoma candidum]|uniref:Uncharacterized protein n=1 Tax=Melastoma candidum TaxID=119954 RepID=A0ACB9QYT5_9MYRT|nr:hypothetical protein MLD38_018920 [Melastoma candidum]
MKASIQRQSPITTPTSSSTKPHIHSLSSTKSSPNRRLLIQTSSRPFFGKQTSSNNRLSLSGSLPFRAVALASLPPMAQVLGGGDGGKGGGEGEGEGRVKGMLTPYEEAMEALSSLITKRSRADKSNKGDRFELLFDYLKILDLEDQISKMKIIHVAGTKGKGSTCTFAESILRNCGFHTGLFTSPHLIDVRERFRLDGEEICEEKFLAYFWWCFDRFKEKIREDLPMPTYFRFLSLLAFKIFADEQVDVVILEVGLGGRFDSTNVIEKPVVCGIASLGYDHMEILGNTLGEIAGEKAGIFKRGVPGFTVPQPDEAMRVLEQKASDLDVDLQVASPLEAHLLKDQKLGLVGEHQYTNAGLAVALCCAWLQRTGYQDVACVQQMSSLPDQFIRGLMTACLQGRAQVVPDGPRGLDCSGELTFYLDGAHSPESMEICARWFSTAVQEGEEHKIMTKYPHLDASGSSTKSGNKGNDGSDQNLTTQILLFNCMSVRDPKMLLPPLLNTCSNHGVYFAKALFVPNISVYYKVGSTGAPQNDSQIDLTWQFTLQRIWESLVQAKKGGEHPSHDGLGNEVKEETEGCVKSYENSVVFTSLPLAIKWLRDTAQQNRSVRFQVLVTGSLHLVGDVLRLIKR